MLLQRLAQYADTLDLPPELYNESPVRYIVELDGGGRLLSPQPIDTADPSSPRTKRGQRFMVPQIQRTVGIQPLLLADNAEYTFGLARDPAKQARVDACHKAYLDLVERCAAATREPAVEAVIEFMYGDGVAALDLPDDYDRGSMITFRVDGVLPIDLPLVQTFWKNEHDPAADTEQPARVMQCIVCGQQRPVLERLQGKLKGVPGGQTAGTALISANATAFESYGLEASLIAPTCASCGERFTKGANALIADQSSRLIIGGGVFIFWTREQVGFNLLTCFTDPDTDEVKQMIDAVRSGRRVPDVDDTAFYAAILSGSGGRAVVRDWIDTTVGEAKQHVADWFQRQRIVDAYGMEGRPLKLNALAAATVRELNDVTPPTAHALLHSALTGEPLPWSLLYQAVRRNRAEQTVTRQRAALIKLVLLGGQPITEEDTMVDLDAGNPSPAYRCGRLLAVLEEVQRQAIPGAKAGIVDRFFGTASSAPASVFGRLLRGAQPHLAKLERDRPGAYRGLQRRLEEVLAGLGTFPRTLTLEEQGLFSLGYYHQRAHDRAAVERRKAGAVQPGSDNDVDNDSDVDVEVKE